MSWTHWEGQHTCTPVLLTNFSGKRLWYGSSCRCSVSLFRWIPKPHKRTLYGWSKNRHTFGLLIIWWRRFMPLQRTLVRGMLKQPLMGPWSHARCARHCLVLHSRGQSQGNLLLTRIMHLFLMSISRLRSGKCTVLCYELTPIFFLLYFLYSFSCHVIVMWSLCDLLFLWCLLFCNIYCSVTHCPGWLHCPCDVHCSCDSIVLIYYKY